MLTEIKNTENIVQEQLLEKWAMSEEIENTLVPIVQLSKETFKDLQNKADDLSASQSQVSKRLDHLEARHINAETQKPRDETIQAYTSAIEEQENLLLQLEEQLLSQQQSNNEFAKSIERLKQTNVKLSDLFNICQSQSSNETILSKLNDKLTKIVGKVDGHQSEINALEAERLKIDNKVVGLRSRQNQHSHSSNYTYGSYNGYAGYSSGPV